jgi:hypothetical protein
VSCIQGSIPTPWIPSQWGAMYAVPVLECICCCFWCHFWNWDALEGNCFTVFASRVQVLLTPFHIRFRTAHIYRCQTWRPVSRPSKINASGYLGTGSEDFQRVQHTWREFHCIWSLEADNARYAYTAGLIPIDEVCCDVPYALWAFPEKQWHFLIAAANGDEAIEAPSRVPPLEVNNPPSPQS